MERSNKDAWLSPDAGDLEVTEVEDVPVKGQSVKIRALSATAANGATSQAITTFDDRGTQKMKVDSVMLDILRFQAGVIEPQFSVEEARQISNKFGVAFNRVSREIVRISGLSEEAVTETEARFPGSGGDQGTGNGTGATARDAGSDQPVRAIPSAGTDGK